jgi:hypothetical protein
MIHDLDAAIEKLIEIEMARPPIDLIKGTHYDISFTVPNKTFSPARATINLYAYYIHEDRMLLDNQPRVKRLNGVAVLAKAPIQITIHYLVTAWSKDTRDEHRLLSQTIFALTRHSYITPKTIFSSTINLITGKSELEDRISSPIMREAKLPAFTAQPENLDHIGEFWTSMENSWRPTLCYVVTIPIDLDHSIEGPIVTTEIVGYQQDKDPTSSEAWVNIGGIVRDAAGEAIPHAWVGIDPDGPTTTTDKDGRFILTLQRGLSYRLIARAPGLGEAPRDIEVPSLTGEYDLKLL